MSRLPWIERYEDKAGEHRWRLHAGNGRIVADSGEGYVSESNLDRAIATAAATFAKAWLCDSRNMDSLEK